MDFLDPEKVRSNKIKIIVGYVLLAIVILLGATILLYTAFGFGLQKGKIIQSGLAFFSSHPGNATITLNGQQRGTTSARLSLPAGKYDALIQRSGYRDWERAITIEGGEVEHFDYPFLIPSQLVTINKASYTAKPALVTQSPDRRWLLALKSSSLTAFDEYDLKNPKLAAVTLSLPANLLTPSAANQSLALVEWSTDNKHVLLKHTYGSKYEYIMMDITTPSKSLNLNKFLGSSPTQLTLQDKKYDHYFYYDGKTKLLGTTSISDTKITPLLQHVLAYTTYGSNIVVYAVSDTDKTGQTQIMLYQNGNSYPIHESPKSSNYLLNVATYSGKYYVIAGSSSEGRAYIYKDPVSALTKAPYAPLVPIDVLKVADANYESFSNNAQFVMAENGSSFSVYDIENDKSYTYTNDSAFDKSQVHAAWMDGDRLDYVSKGKLIIFDYDDTNEQALLTAYPGYGGYFDPGYKFVEGFSANTSAASAKTKPIVLTSTALLTPADQ